MKSVYTLLLLSLLLACNNAGNSNTSTTPNADSTGERKVVSAEPKAAGCAAMGWFRKGASFNYEMKDGTGKTTGKTTTSISDVRQDGNALLADYSIAYGEKGQVLSATYRCEGNKLMVDMKTLMGDFFSSLNKTGMEIEVKNAYLTIPWDMKTGDNLEDATMEVSTKKDGKEFITMKSVVKNRKVEGTESVSTSGGTWDCIKLTETRTTTTSMMGRQVSSNDMKSIQWFSPTVGIVRQENYDDKGKLTFSTELIAVK